MEWLFKSFYLGKKTKKYKKGKKITKILWAGPLNIYTVHIQIFTKIPHALSLQLYRANHEDENTRSFQNCKTTKMKPKREKYNY